MKISIDRRFRAKPDRSKWLSLGFLFVFLVCELAVIQRPANCFAQPASRMKGERPFRENVTLPFDTNLLKRFGTVEDLLANQRWNESIAILQEIAQTESQSLVLVQPGKAGGVATYLNANNRCNVLLSRIPAEGRLIYRQKFDAQAKRWFENWQRTRDQTELLKIVRQTYLSSHTDDALVALGEVAWDAGDFALARQWWEQLIPLPNEADPAKYPTVLRYPDAKVDRPTTLARILSCSILERDWNRAADELINRAHG